MVFAYALGLFAWLLGSLFLWKTEERSSVDQARQQSPTVPVLRPGGFCVTVDKLTKKKVNYRPAVGIRRCGSCAMFRPRSDACDLVAGRISSDDTCDRWVKKEKT